MRKVVCGLLGLVGLVAVGVVAACSWLAYSLGGDRGWTSVNEHADEEMRAVTELPVLWLGKAYDADGDGTAELELSGFQLTDRNANNPSATEPRYEMVVGYGRCKFPPMEGGCPLPLTIAFSPPCENIDQIRRSDLNVADIRGVEGRLGDSLTLFTKDYQIRIWSHAASAVSVAEQLRGANDLAVGVTPGSDLPRLPQDYC